MTDLFTSERVIAGLSASPSAPSTSIKVALVRENRVSLARGYTFTDRLESALRHGGPTLIDESGVVTKDLVSDENTTLVAAGGVLAVEGSLTIHGPIVAPDTTLFTVSAPSSRDHSKVRILSKSDLRYCNPHVREIPVLWFRDTTDDIGVQIQKAIGSVGRGGVVRLPPGDRVLRTPVDCSKALWGDHFAVRGQSHIGSTISIAQGLRIVGLDLRSADEVMLDCVRVKQNAPGRKSCALLLGGTGNRVTNCWFSNTKYGVVSFGGADNVFTDMTIERCLYGHVIAPGYSDPPIFKSTDKDTVVKLRSINENIHKCDVVGLYIGIGDHWQPLRNLQFTNATFNQSKLNMRIEGKTPGDIGVSFSNCTMDGSRTIEAPFAGAEISAAKVNWTGGSVWDNPDWREYRPLSKRLSNEPTCGFYLSNGAVLTLVNVAHGNYVPTIDSQHTLYRIAENSKARAEVISGFDFYARE